MDKELKQRIKNGTVENNKIKKHHHKNEKNKKDKNKEIIDSDEDDELVIPTFGEHPGLFPKHRNERRSRTKILVI